MKLILILILMISTVSAADIKYEDLPKDHWAYSSVNNLVIKGIIPQEGYLFKGEGYVKRYDFAFYLSNTLNKLELEKADRRDLKILEGLVAEFSVELTKIGYDTSTFNARINNINETIELLKSAIEENQKAIKVLEDRLKKLE